MNKEQWRDTLHSLCRKKRIDDNCTVTCLQGCPKPVPLNAHPRECLQLTRAAWDIISFLHKPPYDKQMCIIRKSSCSQCHKWTDCMEADFSIDWAQPGMESRSIVYCGKPAEYSVNPQSGEKLTTSLIVAGGQL